MLDTGQVVFLFPWHQGCGHTKPACPVQQQPQALAGESTDVQQQERRFEELTKLRQSPLWLAASWLPFTWLRLESARLEIRWLLPSPTPTFFFFFFGIQISEIKLLLESRI